MAKEDGLGGLGKLVEFLGTGRGSCGDQQAPAHQTRWFGKGYVNGASSFLYLAVPMNNNPIVIRKLTIPNYKLQL